MDDHYVTGTGIKILRRVEALPYESALDIPLSGIDKSRGAVFASGYEYRAAGGVTGNMYEGGNTLLAWLDAPGSTSAQTWAVQVYHYSATDRTAIGGGAGSTSGHYRGVCTLLAWEVMR